MTNISSCEQFFWSYFSTRTCGSDDDWYDTSLYLALIVCVVISHIVWCILRWHKDKHKEWLHYIYLLNHTRNTLYQSSE